MRSRDYSLNLGFYILLSFRVWCPYYTNTSSANVGF